VTRNRMPKVHSSGGSKRHLLRNQQKRFAREHFAFAREEKRFAREHFTFAREQKRFPRCRRSGVVFPRSVHPPSDPGVAKRDRPPAVSLQKEQLFKKFQERCIFRPLSRVLWVEGSFFSLGGRLIGSSRGVARAPRTLTMCVSGRGEGVSKGDPLANRIVAQQVSSLKPCEGSLYFEQVMEQGCTLE